MMVRNERISCRYSRVPAADVHTSSEPFSGANFSHVVQNRAMFSTPTTLGGELLCLQGRNGPLFKNGGHRTLRR
jgi:hypothetical protein